MLDAAIDNITGIVRSLFSVFMLCTVDANNAGAGELSIIVNNGSVPSSARLIAHNIYAVSFMPAEPGIYTVELFFNSHPLKGSTFPSDFFHFASAVMAVVASGVIANRL